MKQFKKLAACLLAVVMALGMLTACGREILDIQYDAAKKADAVAALNQYFDQTGKTPMVADERMEKAAHNGLEPAVSYLLGKISIEDSALAIWFSSGLTQSELQNCYNEHRFVKIVIPESQYSQKAVLASLKREMTKVNAATASTKYGMEVATYEGNVYVAMFMM